jgi:osmotically inducible protein OsmC
MPIATRHADVKWEGSLAKGAGNLSTGSEALNQLGVTWASRTESPDGKTSPEELIAAAHASCFAMALALVLGEASTPPKTLAINCACTLDEVDGAPRITMSQITVRAEVPAIDEPDFNAAVEKAAALCPVSNALSGNVSVEVSGQLDPVRD